MAVGTVTISRTPSSTGNRKTWTLSYWIKRGELSSTQQFWNVNASVGGGTDYMYMRFMSADTLYLESETGGVSNIGFTTTRLFRDPGAWYHIVLAVDTAQAVSTDRWKVYINGVDEADTGGYSSSSYSTQDVLTSANTDTYVVYIGTDDGGIQGFNGEMSHVQMVDGLALAPTEFGEFDSTSGIWKIKPGCYATPGTNGFCLKMEDRDNLDLDSSSNAHTFTTAGTLTATYDNPSNNFATMNPLNNFYAAATFSNGNNTILTQAAAYSANTATIHLTSGKWYWESRFDASGGSDWLSGITGRQHNAAAYLGSSTQDYGYIYSGGVYHDGVNTTSGYDALSSGTGILGTYLDLDNSKLYFGVDGVVQNSGTGISLVALSTLNNSDWAPAFGDGGSGTATASFNFGNGYFGTTAVTSAVADEGGIGAFEYDPSAGTFDSSSKDFRAVCTKNIKAYGG